METETVIEKVKLTKSALNKFIRWSKSRYNNYCGYGTKSENVNRIYNSLKNGCETKFNGDKVCNTTFEVLCAQAVGENGAGRYWHTKEGSEDYIIDCVNKSVTGKYTKRSISFL